jgi:hypothetical protein
VFFNNDNNNNNARNVSCGHVKHISSFDIILPTGFGPLSFLGSGVCMCVCVEGWNGWSAIRDSVCLRSYIGYLHGRIALGDISCCCSPPGLLATGVWLRACVCVCVFNTHTTISAFKVLCDTTS